MQTESFSDTFVAISFSLMLRNMEYTWRFVCRRFSRKARKDKNAKAAE